MILPKVAAPADQLPSQPYSEVSRNKSQALFQRTVERFSGEKANDWAKIQDKLVVKTNRNQYGTPLMLSQAVYNGKQ